MRLDGAGQRVWPQERVFCDAVGRQQLQRASAISDSEVIAVWMDARTTPLWLTDPQAREIYAQKLRIDGTEVWEHNGTRILTEAYPDWYGAGIVPNARGGFAGAYTFNTLTSVGDLKLVNIGGDGLPLPGWPADGLVIANDPAAGEGGELSVSPVDESILLIWGDGYNLRRPKAQKVSATGEILWPNGGIALYDTTATLAGWSMASDGEGGAFVGIEYPYGDADIIAQHVRADGSMAWPGWGVPVTTAPGLQYVSFAEADGSGGVHFCWRDYRNPATDPDLYAQHVNADGSLGGVVTATEASAVEASVVDGCARVVWYASEATGEAFTVEREAGASEWTAIGTATADGTGRLEHRDCDVMPGATYAYRLAWISDGLERHTVPISLAIESTPGLSLAPLAPNPIVSEATLEFTLPRAGRVRLEVIDLAGRRVAVPLDAARDAGTHRLAWEGRDAEGRRLAPGCYVLRLSAESEQRVRRFVVVR